MIMKNKKITLITILSISVVFICHGGDSENENFNLENYLNDCMSKRSTIPNTFFNDVLEPLPPLSPLPPSLDHPTDYLQLRAAQNSTTSNPVIQLPTSSVDYSQQDSTNIDEDIS